jgi:DNA polymerase-3 subunit delta'
LSWAHVIGHDAWVSAFRDVVRRNRLAHAYLFVGPPGVGKRTFAIEFAKALLCEQSSPDLPLTACDRCAACLLVDARTHPDLFVVGKPEDKNELPIGVMRELCDSFRMKSARGLGKVAVLDDADDMNDEAANCFLKTLEEPPPRSIFILIGTSLERQLPTIRSRCHTVRFAPLAPETVRQLLEKSELQDKKLIPALVRLAEGSPGTALALADPSLWEFRNRLLAGLAASRVDTLGLGKAFDEFVQEAGKEPVLQRERAALMIRLLLAGLRDALRLRLGEPAPAAEEAQLLQPLARRADPDKLLRLIDRALEAEIQLDRYLQVVLVLEGLLDAFGQILES